MEAYMRLHAKALLLVAVLAPLAAIAQPGRSSTVYRVDFNIKDTGDAGAKAGRKYSLLINDRQKSVFRVGSRVPTITGGGSTTSAQYTYIDVGVNIDCTVAEQNGLVGMHADLDLSGAVGSDHNMSSNPTISQIRLAIDTTLTPGKPTVVASFDDPVTSRRFEVEATVTRL
jgi:hypothetical protein